MLPLGNNSVPGSAPRPALGGGAPPQTRPRGMAVSGGSYRDPLLLHQQQRLAQQSQPQQLLEQAAGVSPIYATQGVVQRSSSSLSRGDSLQLLDPAGKRAAMASYPSAGEVLLRHGSSKNVPAFHPRPQPGVQWTPATVAVAGGTPAMRVFPSIPGSRFTAASPGAPNVPGAGQYVSVPVRSSTAGHTQMIYTQNVYRGPTAEKQPPHIGQGGHQWPLITQQEQAKGQETRYSAYPLPYIQQQQQRQQWQQHQLYQGQPTRGQPPPAQNYTGTPPLHHPSLQQQSSLPTLTKDSKRANGEPRFLKSALRSYASSQIAVSSHASSLKSSPSVRFALDEDEVFRKEEEAPEEASEGVALAPGSVEALRTGGFEAAEVLIEPKGTAAPAATAPTVTGTACRVGGAPAGGEDELAFEEGTVPTEASATPPPAGLTGPSEREAFSGAATVTPGAARGTGPGTVFAVEEVPLAAPSEQRGEGLEKAAGGGLGGPDERNLEFKYQRVPPSDGEQEAPELGKMAASTRPQPMLNGSSEAFEEEKSPPGLNENREKRTLSEKAPTRDPTTAGDTGYHDSVAQPQVLQQSVIQQAQGYRRAGKQGQRAEQPEKGDAGKQSEQAGHRLQQGAGQQHGAPTEHQPEEGLKEREKTEGSEAVQMKATCVPCLWIGCGDHPHICLNFARSFQPKLLVRRSSAPALHVYVDEPLPVEDYFKVREATPGGAAAATRPNLAPFAVEQAALTAAVTAGSKAKPAVTAGPERKLSSQGEKTKVPEEQITKPQVVQEAEEREKIESDQRHKREGGLVASTDSAKTPVDPGKDVAKTARDAAAGDTIAGGGASSADISAGDVTRAEGPETHGLSRRDWSIVSSFFSFSASTPRSPSRVLPLGSLPFEFPEKRVPEGSRRDSNVSTSDGFSADEAEWRLEMARPTILLHRSFHTKNKQQQNLSSGGGSATATQAAGVKSQRVLIVVDTTTEWWPSVQVRWVDGKKPWQALEQRPYDQQGAEGHSEAGESTQAETQDAENERLICRGHPTNLAGICIWSKHRPTLLDRRF